MHWMRTFRRTAFILLLPVFFCGYRSHAQAALLVEEPYGFFGAINPTGHNAIYLQRICAETPVKLRRCQPGELGSVISRYQGIDGYDWIAMPLIPYLYSVQNASEVPDRVDHEQVQRMRDRYREQYLESLGENLSAGGLVRGGWKELLGAAYERHIYAFRFETTPEQDNALIAQLNERRNQSHFNLLFNNCADFARGILNLYFPGTFRRSIFPDAGVTTPKQIAYKLVRHARKHSETHLTIYQIDQIPGNRRSSHSNKNIAESLVTTGYAIPITLLNPYIAGGLLVDYLVRGRFHLIPTHPEVLKPDNLLALTEPEHPQHNAGSTGARYATAAADASHETRASAATNSLLKENEATHE